MKHFFILFVFFISTGLWAQEGLLNKLLAPGPLVKGHSNLEKSDCLKCHDAGKGLPDANCLACHKEIKVFVDSKKGFHGLNTATCRECHGDHKGRNHNMVAVDEKTFQHAPMTGYALEGKHAEIKCSECHTAKFKNTFVNAGAIRYFGNQATCVSCHKKDDPHQFKGKWAQKDCATCHTSNKSWKGDTKFNHKIDTGYELVGKHNELKCADCHGPNKKQKQISYKWPKLKSQQCLTCHEDQHKKNFSAKYQGGGACVKCHSQTVWKIEKFDHKVTGYPLKGKHFELKCIECHHQPQKKIIEIKDKNFKFLGLKKACLSCHEDHHKFGNSKMKHIKNPNDCLTCHTETGWKKSVRFDHANQTRFPVDGEHLKLDCLECHTKQDKNKRIISSHYKWPLLTSKTCENCHETPHRKEFSPALLKKQCTECHVTSGWYNMKDGSGFDHSKTRFPLTGAHLKTRCADCHGEKGKQNFKFKALELKFCVDCHQNIHKNQFSPKIETQNCVTCHTTETFYKRLEFDHSKTQYPLLGAHEKLKCEECHVPTSAKVLLVKPNIHVDLKTKVASKPFTLSQFNFPSVKKSECLSCHVDHHKSQLGTQCLNCHNSESWKKIKFDHDKQSDFPLRFEHEKLKCAECHKPIPNITVVNNRKKEVKRVIRFKPIASDCLTCHKDAHRGEFGKKCQECHTERGWKVTKDFHKNFTLTGVHFSLQCNECHQESRKLSGLSQQCLTCHAKDDVHNGTLPQCQDCHKQQFWEVTGFKHSLTQFPLRGAHRTLDCMECHRSGTYKGLSSQCASCHLQEALAVPAPNHSGFTNLNQCNECHSNQFSW